MKGHICNLGIKIKYATGRVSDRCAYTLHITQCQNPGLWKTESEFSSFLHLSIINLTHNPLDSFLFPFSIFPYKFSPFSHRIIATEQVYIYRSLVSSACLWVSILIIKTKNYNESNRENEKVLMGILNPASELSLDFKPTFIPKTISQFLGEVARIGSVSEKILKVDDFVSRLEIEIRKIDAFKRELPLCMLLMNDGSFLCFPSVAWAFYSSGLLLSTIWSMCVCFFVD